MSKHPKNANSLRDEARLRKAQLRKPATRAAKGAASHTQPRRVRPDDHQLGVAIDKIARNCGPGTKRLLLSSHPRLPGPVILKIARKHPDRQRFALTQARAGRNPLGPPPPGVAPPFDTLHPGKVLNRLGRNTGALNKVADGLLELPHDRWPEYEEVAAMLTDAEVIARQARQMKCTVEDSKSRTPGGKVLRPTGSGRASRTRKPFDPRVARRDVAAVAGVTAKNFRDLPRTLTDTPPTEAQRETLLTRLGALEASAVRLGAVNNWRGHDRATGPSGVPGTYVVFFRLTRPKKRLTIGALGTFDFPAGVYAYLGSAFGGGGVRKRTGRHLTTDTKKKWNIDWLKPHCTPVAVWWTHDRRKVEFAWAEVLAALPGASFPAPRFGAADNKNAEAHLVRFDEVPGVSKFRRLLTASVSEHATVFEHTIETPTGKGWPECPPVTGAKPDTEDMRMSIDGSRRRALKTAAGGPSTGRRRVS